MAQRTLLEARPMIRAFHQVIPAVIQKGVYRSGPEGRPSDAFIYVLEGTTHYDLSTGTLDVKAGDFFYFARHTVYTMTVKTDVYRVIIANFDCEPQPEEPQPEEPLPEEPLESLKGRTPTAESRFHRLLSAWQAQGMAVREECLAQLYRIYGDLITAAETPYRSAASRRRIQAAILYIGEHLGEASLSVPQIAAHAGLSESHFRRLFREVMGLSPLAYLHRQRIQLAKEQLCYSHDSISRIAENAGFASAYHFSHAFKKETGESPRAYRQQHSPYPQT